MVRSGRWAVSGRDRPAAHTQTRGLSQAKPWQESGDDRPGHRRRSSSPAATSPSARSVSAHTFAEVRALAIDSVQPGLPASLGLLIDELGSAVLLDLDAHCDELLVTFHVETNDARDLASDQLRGTNARRQTSNALDVALYLG